MKRTAIVPNEEIERRYNALPEAVAEAFESAHTAELIFEIGKKYGLAIDMIGNVAREVGYVMLGVIPSSEFAGDLAEIVADQKKAAAVAAEISQRVFLPIRELLRTETKAPTKPSAAPERLLPPKAPPPGTTPPPRAPEPLIISPLPRANAEPPATPRPPSVAAPNGALAQSAVRPTLPVDAKPSPLHPLPAPPPKPIAAERPAPIVRPFGATPAISGAPGQPLDAKQEKQTLPVTGPPKPVTPPVAKPPPPSAAYERAREEVKRELETFQRNAPVPPPAPLRPASESAPSQSAAVTPAAPTPKSPYVITKEELQTEIERFQPKPADSGQRVADSALRPATEPTAPLPAASATPPPLKLPQEKIPKPPAPERYETDPYKEPFE